MDSGTSAADEQTPRQPLLICFSHLRWDFVYQRPQHLMTRAAITYRVIYFEEPVFSDVALPVLVFSEDPTGVRVATPHLPRDLSPDRVIPALRLLVGDLLLDEPGAAVFWYYTPMAFQFTSQLRASVVVYDNMDELSAFRGASPLLLSLEAQLLDRASVVFTGGNSLFQAKKHRHANIHSFPSSIDADHFRQARRSLRRDPDDQRGIPRPRIGFFGVIDERMDLDLVASAAAYRRDLQFVMVGPVVKIDPASLPQAPNIHWLGQKKYEELPAYLGGWDIGFMPFALNESTRFISPTKTPEFLAAGLTVISTAVPDVIDPYGDAGLVEIVDSAQELLIRADRLLRRPADPTRWAHTEEFLSSNSWDLTWSRMSELLTKAADHAATRLLTEMKEQVHV
jgi:glycosyltransferase involved in cell wall biosynthesis